MQIRPLFVFFVSLAVAFPTSTRFAFAADDLKPVEAKLVAKGDGYLVHVLPQRSAPPFDFGMPKRFGLLNPNTTLVHTSTETGKMRCLFISGHESARSLPMGIDRIHHVSWRLAGTSASGDHLFVLTWHAKATVLLTGGPQRAPKFNTGQWDVSVFRLRDGNKVTSIKLTGDSLPKSTGSEVYGEGPLKIKDDKITVFKQVLQLHATVLAA